MNSIMEAVCSVCVNVRNNCARETGFHELLVKLRREFRKENFAIRIRSVKDRQLDTEEFYVNAYYDPEDDSDHEIPIEVILHHNFAPNAVWDRKQVTDILIQVFDAVVHEFRHQRQSRKRYFKTYWHHYGYLNDPDEVDAYSISIAIELCRTMGKHRALRYLPYFTSISRLKIQHILVSPTLNSYVSLFNNINDPVLRSLAKKTYIRIQKLDTDCIFM